MSSTYVEFGKKILSAGNFAHFSSHCTFAATHSLWKSTSKIVILFFRNSFLLDLELWLLKPPWILSLVYTFAFLNAIGEASRSYEQLFWGRTNLAKSDKSQLIAQYWEHCWVLRALLSIVGIAEYCEHCWVLWAFLSCVSIAEQLSVSWLRGKVGRPAGWPPGLRSRMQLRALHSALLCTQPCFAISLA